MNRKLRYAFIAGVIGMATALAIAATSSGQLTGGGGMTKVVTGDSRLTGSGTTAAPLAMDVAGTAGRIIGTGSAGSRFDLATTAVSAGTFTNTTVTFDAFGRATAASSGTAGAPTSRQILAGTGLSGGGDLTADRTLNLANTAVTPGSYTVMSATVDAQGRLTAASTGVFSAGTGNFGDGSDGSASLSGAQTISRDQFYTTLTLASGTTLTCTSGRSSCRVFAHSIVVTSGTATISVPGLDGSGATAGAGLTGGPTGAASGAGAGGIQNNGQNAVNFASSWPTSFRAGAGGTGGIDGASSHPGGTGSIANALIADDSGGFNTWIQASLGAISMNNPGRAGGGGGGGSGGGTTGICSGGGGGGGAGVIIVAMRSLSGNLVVTTPGGVGGATTGGVGCLGAGGGGGGGGYTIVGYGGSSQPGGLTLSAPGGAGGTGLGGGTTGSTGGAGKTMFFALGPS